jgi:RNA recognition motif-containing protein
VHIALPGLEIAPNGITQTFDEAGRIMGDAFVQFTSPEMAEKACDYHMKMIGKRSYTDSDVNFAHWQIKWVPGL